VNPIVVTSRCFVLFKQYFIFGMSKAIIKSINRIIVCLIIESYMFVLDPIVENSSQFSSD